MSRTNVRLCGYRETKVVSTFTADFLAATDRLELLCCQSDAIRMKSRSNCHAISVLFIVFVVVVLHV